MRKGWRKGLGGVGSLVRMDMTFYDDKLFDKILLRKILQSLRVGDEWIGGSILSSGTHESPHTQTGLLPLLEIGKLR